MPERAEERQRGTASAGAAAMAGVGAGSQGAELAERLRNGPRRPEPLGAGRAESAADRRGACGAEGAATRRAMRSIPEARAAAREASAEGGRGTGARRRERARAAARSAGAPLFSCHCAGGDHPAEWRRPPSRVEGTSCLAAPPLFPSRPTGIPAASDSLGAAFAFVEIAT